MGRDAARGASFSGSRTTIIARGASDTAYQPCGVLALPQHQIARRGRACGRAPFVRERDETQRHLQASPGSLQERQRRVRGEAERAGASESRQWFAPYTRVKSHYVSFILLQDNISLIGI